MDDNFLRNIGYFTVPNNQTLHPVDQYGDASGLGSQIQSPSLWDGPNLASAGLSRTRDTSSGAPGLPLGSPAPSTAASSLNMHSPVMSSSSVFDQPHRPIFSPRPQRARDGHEKKRSRLNTEATPFDSVDYWIQFDQEQQGQQQQEQQQEQSQEQSQEEPQQRRRKQQQQLHEQLLQQQRQQQKQQQLLLQQQQLQQLRQQQLQQRQAQRQQQQQQKQQPKQKQEQEKQQKQKDKKRQKKAPNSQVEAPTPQRSTAMASQSQTPSTAPQKSEEGVLDDTALEKALSDEEEEGLSFSSIDLAEQLSKIDSAPPTEIPQREGLYSTPLSWERPQMGLQLDPMLGLQTSTLSEAEQRRLIAIAMNSGTPMSGLSNNISSNYNTFPMFGPGLGTVSLSQISNNDLMNAMLAQNPSVSAEPQQQQPSRPEKRAKTEKEKEKPKAAERTAHNDIERKYRTNLKDRIAELRVAVPALRTIPEDGVDDVDGDGDGDGDGSNQAGRAPKVSKGTVLTKATEYIHHLEKKNKAIMKQHQELSRRLQAFEQLLNATARPTFQMPHYSRTLFDPRAFC